MRTSLALACTLVLLSACDASSTLQGTWNVERWTYGVGGGDGSVITNEAVVEDAGTLEFSEGVSPSGYGELILTRRLNHGPRRGSDQASFFEVPVTDTDIVGYDAGGPFSEENQITVFDIDTLWNGAWILDGSTLSRGYLTDFGGGAALREESTFELAR